MVQQQLIDLVEPIVASYQLELWGCEFRQDQGRQLFCVYIDGVEGVTLDQCAAVSRDISAVMDVEDLIPTRYSLEVSSPGLNRPLYTVNHYARYVGQAIKLRLRMPTIEGQRNFSGRIESVNTDKNSVVIGLDLESQEFALADIEKAYLVADFAR